jgi:hypothetical protein
MWRGVIYYLAGLTAVLATAYVLPANPASIYLYFGGMIVFIVSNVQVIIAAAALELVAARSGAWLPNRNTLILTIAVLAMSIWIGLRFFVWS